MNRICQLFNLAFRPCKAHKHIGTDSDEVQRAKRCRLGCAPAHKLFETVKIKRRADVELPRDYTDYDVTVDLGAVPSGVEIGFMTDPYGDISWSKIPEDNSWLRA